MQVSKSSSSCENLRMGSESLESVRFSNSLQELKGLRSQLHFAADYCETSFLRAKEKKVVMEDTKEYICKAVVTVVDHLGNVSSNLDSLVSDENSFSDAELRINCLNQKLDMCQEYAQKLALAKLRWNVRMPRHCLHYISTPGPVAETLSEALRDSDSSTDAKATKKQEVQKEGEVPVFYYTNNHKPSVAKNSTASKLNIINWESSSDSVLPPTHGGLPMPKARNNPPFHFQHSHKLGHGALQRKSAWRNEFLAFVRRRKQTA